MKCWVLGIFFTLGSARGFAAPLSNFLRVGGTVYSTNIANVAVVAPRPYPFPPFAQNSGVLTNAYPRRSLRSRKALQMKGGGLYFAWPSRLLPVLYSVIPWGSLV